MSKSFIEYHGCDLYNYKDGTRKQVLKCCNKATHYPFWKLPKDVTNSVAESTRAQLKNKKRATEEDILQYKMQHNLVSIQTFTISNELTGDNLIIVDPDDLIENTNSNNK